MEIHELKKSWFVEIKRLHTTLDGYLSFEKNIEEIHDKSKYIIPSHLEVVEHLFERGKVIKSKSKSFAHLNFDLLNIQKFDDMFFFEIKKELAKTVNIFGKEFFNIETFTPVIAMVQKNNIYYLLICCPKSEVSSTINEVAPLFTKWNFGIIDVKFKEDTQFKICKSVKGQFILSNHDFAQLSTKFTEIRLKGMYDPDDLEYREISRGSPSLTHIVQTSELKPYTNITQFRFQMSLKEGKKDIVRIGTRQYLELDKMVRFIKEIILPHVRSSQK